MLGYEWTTNHSSNNNSPPHHPQLMLSDVVDNLNHHHHHHHNHNHDHDHDHDNYGHNHISSQSSDHHHRQIFDDQFNTHQYAFPNHNHNNDNNYYQTQLSFSDPRAFQGASPSMFTLDGLSSGFSPVIPKTEPDPILNRPIGLNLGGRTYFSPDDDLVSRLYRRSSRPADVAANVPKCQAEGCNADLSSAKHYHRRHKVCEFHSKASTVIANGLIQRFCQQCSRFHMLAEFDNGKRSCRKRLADHNRRRRKSHQVVTQDHRMASPMSSENAPTSPSPRSPKSNSGMNSTSSVTVAMSPPQVSYDSSFRPRLY